MRIVKLLLFLFLASCASQDKPPEDLLGTAEMAAILTDIHLAEARVSQLGLRSLDSSVIVFDTLQREIWRKYKLDTARYNRSYRFYASHPEKFAEVYEIVTKELERKDSTDRKIEPKAK